MLLLFIILVLTIDSKLANLGHFQRKIHIIFRELHPLGPHQGSALDPLGGSQCPPPRPPAALGKCFALMKFAMRTFHVFSLIALLCLIVAFVVCGLEPNLLYFVTPLKKKAIFFKRFYDFFMISYMKSFNSLKSKKGY